MERAIEGRDIGTEVEVEVEPDEGYGDRDPEGIFFVPRAAFPGDEPLDAGMTFSAIRPDGQAVIFRVVQVDPEMILVDTNHPLAGRTLQIWVAVRGVREATDDEIVHGHANPFTQAAPLLS